MRVLAAAWLALGVAVGVHAANEDDLDAEERAFLGLINSYRAANGLGALQHSRVLSKVANWMSSDMGTSNRFSHTDSLGRDPFQRMDALGYNFNAWKGENIFAGRQSAQEAFDAWRNSPSHNANMLHSEYKVLGVARAYFPGSTYKWYWSNEFGGFVDPSTEGRSPAVKINAATHSASYVARIARGGMATLFGENLAQATATANTVPLPTMLGATLVKVNGVPAGLFYVGAGQINFFVPESTATGEARIEVVVGDKVSPAFTMTVHDVAPGLFTAKSDGKGAAVGLQTFDGVQHAGLTNADGSTRAVDAGTLERPSYLVLFGTGWRNALSKGDARVTIAGYDAPVEYAGQQGYYVGLDQLNVRVPYVLRGAGEVDLVLTVSGIEANRVKVRLQ